MPLGHETPLPAVTIADLLRATLRHRPDRIIVGEVRGAEAFDLLQALNTGHLGSLRDRKSTRLNSSHPSISYAVFCLKKKNMLELPSHPLTPISRQHAAVC